MRRREFIAGIGSAAASSPLWPLAARAQQPALPVVGFIVGSPDAFARYAAAFRSGLSEIGYVDGQNVSIEYHWLEGQYDHIPASVAEWVRRRVAVIAVPGNTATALAAKAATSTIPIVFGVGDDPVRLGLVASPARPGGNLTGFFTNEAVPKRLGLLHELVPKASRVAVLVNPRNSVVAETTLRDAQEAARLIELPIDILKASTSREIEEAFATIMRERVEALFIDADWYFDSRRVQLLTLATRHGIATSYSNRIFPEAGGLMSYGTDLAEMYRRVGAYTGQILKGAKPADLPVVQSTRLEFVINMQTARALGIEVPPIMLARADHVIK
jgi:putative tryptophan/tyrosine transport system substrate-binding protein